MTDGPMALRVPEVAQQIGLTVRQVYRLISAGELPTVRIGASRRVLRGDLTAFLEARREPTPAQVA